MNRTITAIVVAVMCGLATQPCAGADLPLIDDPGRGAVILLLDRAEIEVELVPDCEPTLAAGMDGPEGMVVPELTVSSQGGGVQVGREPAHEGEELPLLRLSLTLDPAQSLRVEGRELRISVTGDAVEAETAQYSEEPVADDDQEEGEDAKEAQGVATTDLQLLTEKSQVELRFTGAASVRGTNTSVTAVGCRGEMTIDLHFGFADISGHRGPIVLQGAGNDVRLRDHSGRVTSRLEGGNLSAVNGTGAFNAALEEAGLVLESWHGPGSITGNYSSADVRESGGAQLVITGQVLDLRLNGWDGPVVGRLMEGSLTGGGWEGGANLNLDDASLEIEDISGEVTLVENNRARARLSRVTGTLSVEVRGDSELEVDGADKISVEAEDSFVSIRNVTNMKKLLLSRCEAELDLTGLESRTPHITCSGATTAEVLLESPCLVELKGAGARIASGVVLLGCEMASSQHRRTRRSRVSLEGERATTLTAKLDGEVALTVRGKL